MKRLPQTRRTWIGFRRGKYRTNLLKRKSATTSRDNGRIDLWHRIPSKKQTPAPKNKLRRRVFAASNVIHALITSKERPAKLFMNSDIR